MAQGLEFLGHAVHRFVGDEIHRLAVVRVGEIAERGLAAINREHLHRAGGQIDFARIRLGGGYAFHHQQFFAVGREIQRAPAAAGGDHGPGLTAGDVAHPHIGVGAVARGAAIRQQLAVAREQSAGILRALAVGQQGDVAVGVVEPVQLRELVAALVLREYEAVLCGLRRRGRDAAQRLGIERQLFAHAQRLADAVRLIGFGETGADEQAAVLRPAGDTGAAGVLVAVEAVDEVLRNRRNVFADAVACLFACDARTGRGLSKRWQSTGETEQGGDKRVAAQHGNTLAEDSLRA